MINSKPNIKDWLQAFRLRTLPLSVSGILLGSALAYYSSNFDALLFGLAIFTVLCLQILSNLANDLGDNIKGTDNANRIGPERSTQTGAITRTSMLRMIYVFGALSLLSGFTLAYLGTKDLSDEVKITFFVLALACIAAAIGYTMGRKAYGYLGLGDLSVFLFFGLLSVCGIFVLMAKSLPFYVFLPAAAIGFLSAAVLNLNNLRDHVNDAACGKNTLVVKIGFQKALNYQKLLILAPLLLLPLYVYTTGHFAALIALLSYIVLGKHLLHITRNPYPEKMDSELAKVALSTFLFAVLFSLGCLIA